MGPPLIQIIFFIAINLLPLGQSAFQISTPKGEVFTFTKQETGGWIPSPAPEGDKGIWSIKGDMLSITEANGGSSLKMSQFFSDLDTIKWDTVTSLSAGKTPIRISRKKAEGECTVLSVISGNGRFGFLYWSCLRPGLPGRSGIGFPPPEGAPMGAARRLRLKNVDHVKHFRLFRPKKRRSRHDPRTRN